MSIFPESELDECQSAVFFFCAAFGGRNDVIYAHKREMKDVVLNDIVEDKLNEMKNTYSSQWEYIHGDAFEEAIRFSDEGRKFDLVSCDPFTGLESKVMRNHFLNFYNIANKYMFCMITKNHWHSLGIDITNTVQISSYLSSLHNLNINVSSIVKRSDFKGEGAEHSGVYWAVIKK